MFHYTLAFFFITLIMTGSAKSAEQQLNLYTEHFPPYNYLENEAVVGINTEVVLALCERSGIQCQIRLYPWKRALHMALNDPSGAVFSTSRTSERLDEFQWVGPLSNSKSCFYKLKQRTDIVVHRREDLLNYTLGIVRNDVYQYILNDWGFETGKQLLVYADKHQDIRAFLGGRLDLIIGSRITLPRQLQGFDLSVEDLEAVFPIEDPRLQGNYLALNNSISPSAVRRLQRSLDRLRQDKTLNNIVRRYIEPVDADRPCLVRETG
ncbi:hypothetical protein HMF8227_02275 [Saliniradius amylolyticus]|uniref:Solute-binding protein family 3/N-terminal domain-containing protein n=1 Tax=Saliniradius amylolyticus TaxID=2183582 RepID=A0A2S2E4Z5_9ALTE|nr:transporter substrate-binding domain-containing protein [Saliniradius amylolyticus]AWL12728.1 hypothetical protein HMF8227_02275 [Saliniradius amylolyticus]